MHHYYTNIALFSLFFLKNCKSNASFSKYLKIREIQINWKCSDCIKINWCYKILYLFDAYIARASCNNVNLVFTNCSFKLYIVLNIHMFFYSEYNLFFYFAEDFLEVTVFWVQ